MGFPLDPIGRTQLQAPPAPPPPPKDPKAVAEEVVKGDKVPAGFDIDKVPRGTEQELVDQFKLARLNEALSAEGITPEQSAAIMEEVVRLEPGALKTWLSPTTIDATRGAGGMSQQNAKDLSVALSATYTGNPDLRDDFHAALDQLFQQGARGASVPYESVDKLLEFYSNAPFHPDQRGLREGYAQHLLDTYVVGKDKGQESFHAAGIAASLLTVDNSNPQTVMNVLGKYSSEQISDILVQAQVSVETRTIPADRDVVSKILNAAGDIGESRYSGFPYPPGTDQKQVVEFADKLIGAVGQMGVSAKDDPAIIKATGELFLAYAGDTPATTVDVGGPMPPGLQQSRPAETGLLSMYTSSQPGQIADTTNLATLISLGVFDPAANSIKIGDTPLPKAILGELNQHMSGLLDASIDPKLSPDQQQRAIESFGQLSAAVTGGISKALTNYSDDIKASEESRELFASLVGAVGGDLLPKGGNTFATITSKLTEGVLGVLEGKPDRPDAAMAAEVKDFYDAMIDKFSTDNGVPQLRDTYRSARVDELADLQSKLNINLGGHEE